MDRQKPVNDQTQAENGNARFSESKVFLNFMPCPKKSGKAFFLPKQRQQRLRKVNFNLAAGS